MYAEALGPMLATVLLGAAAPDAGADDACVGPSCGGESRAAQRHGGGDGANGFLSSRARGGLSELPEASTPTSPPPASNEGASRGDGSGDRHYDVGGLADTNSLRAARYARTVRVPVATAYAARLVATQDTCMGARSFGVQAAGFGVSFATTWQDRNCRRLKNARALARLGYREAAVQLLCLDEEVFAAMARAGTPCPGVRRLRAEPEPPAPDPAPPPLITFDDVLFDFDRSTLRPEANHILEPLLAMLQADPEMRIDIEGHTDWVGTDAYNQGLSERRARAVVNWLVAHGVDRERISAAGRGESEPIATNATAEGRQLNRRVEIRRRDT